MFPLIKIRLSYLKRKPKNLFCFYILVPLLFFITCITITSLMDYPSPVPLPKQVYDTYEFFENDTYLFKDKENYSSLIEYFNHTNVLVTRNITGEHFKRYIEDQLGLEINCSTNENDFPKETNQNILKIEYDSKKDSYEFKHTSKLQKLDIFEDLPTFFPFTTSKLSTENVSDVFSFNQEISPEEENYTSYEKISEQNHLFLLYQSFIARFLIEEKTLNQEINKDIHFKFGLNSYPPSKKISFNPIIVSTILGILSIMQFAMIIFNFNIQMIEEKEKKLEQLLERQGVREVTNLLSWLVTFLVLTLLTNVAIIVAEVTFISGHHFLFIFTLVLYNIANFGFMFFFTTIIKDKKKGMIVIPIFDFGSYVICSIFANTSVSRSLVMILGIFPHISQLLSTFCCSNLQIFENLSWDILSLKTKNVTYIETVLMSLVQIVFYYGVAFFIRSYRKSGLNFWEYIKSFFVKVNRKINDNYNNNKNENQELKDNLIDNLDNNQKLISTENLDLNKDLNKKSMFNSYHEELSPINNDLKNKNKYLNILNITRKYGELKAVNDFSCPLFPNEIFCLLGHNGAGKTTLIKMISGQEDPDNGDIFLNSLSLITNKDFLYKNIGLCSQDDIYYEHLTVYEHLNYMAELKGKKTETTSEEICDLLNKIDLMDKKDEYCSTLSGGQKRKLCIALALIGDSQLVLLDEPTSGMDIVAKKKLWSFLKDYKKNKIIILTTHSLDEAEYLGDRIGIMNSGKFICSGTSSFLKEKYPCGFNLNLLVDGKVFKEEKKWELFKEIKKLEPSVEIKVASKGIFSVNIQSNNQNIEEIFKLIDENKTNYGIEDYTVSSTSLEDVFLKLNNKISLNDETIKENENKNDIDININTDTNNDNNNERETLEIKESINFNFNEININTTSFWVQFISHLKRGIFTIWRNKTNCILELLAGLVIVYIYVIAYSAALDTMRVQSLNLIKLLEENPTYVYDNQNFIKSSYIYQNLFSSSSNNFQSIEKMGDINDFIEEIYQKSLAHIGKGGIAISKEEEEENVNKNINLKENKNLYLVYNTEIPMTIMGNNFANSMLIVSSFLKKEYNINAAIFTEVNLESNSDIFGMGIDTGEMILIFSILMLSIVSCNVYLGIIISEKIKERIKNIKHLLYLSGNNMWSYWCGFYFIDIIKYTIFVSLVSLGISFLSGSAKYLCILFIIAGFSAIVFIYVLSFFCEKEESAINTLQLVFFILLLGFFLIFLLIYVLGIDIDYSFIQNVYNFTIFDINPLTSQLFSSIRIIISYFLFKAYESVNESSGGVLPPVEKISGFYQPYEYIKTAVIIQIINLVLYISILSLLESGIFGRFLNYIKVKYIIKDSNITFATEEMSEDFITSNNMNEPTQDNKDNNNINNTNNLEVALVNNNNTNNNNNNSISYIEKEKQKLSEKNDSLTTKIIGLRKTYWQCCKKNVRAVNDLYLGLENNEKFGLLGFNGSGKTTTFKSITHEILYDKGEILLFGKDNDSDFDEIRTIIGYCPQENPLFDYMKVKEIFEFYLNLKNIKESVEKIAEQFDLSEYLNTYCINLSGGNKRKLSFALALMNRPKILLLDEPSTGVDPESRRIMWKNIIKLSNSNNNNINNSNNKFNMILSTHSMEEAEVLCDTVSWLKKGNFVCVGNPEKLKILLSAGYKLHIKFKESQNNINVIDNNEKNDEISTEQNNNFECLNEIKNLVKDFDKQENIIKDDKNISKNLGNLKDVISNIQDKCEEICFKEIRKDYSFEFVIHVIKEKQSELFCQILNMKNNNDNLAEISISMEPLENILTKI